MHIVINVPEKEYKRMKLLRALSSDNECLKYILEGTPLPKGHGRLFDERDIVNGNYEIIGNKIYEVEPIIEADTEESNTDNKSDDELYVDAIDAFKVYATERK